MKRKKRAGKREKKERERELTELSNELASGDKAEKQVDVGG